MSQPQPIDPRYVSRPPQARPKKRRNWFLRTVGLIVLLFILMLVAVPGAGARHPTEWFTRRKVAPASFRRRKSGPKPNQTGGTRAAKPLLVR